MDNPIQQHSGPQLVTNAKRTCSISSKEATARDYSERFHEMVIARFVATQSLKQTARDFSISARVVNEILHLERFRRPVARATTSGLFSVRDSMKVRTA